MMQNGRPCSRSARPSPQPLSCDITLGARQHGPTVTEPYCPRSSTMNPPPCAAKGAGRCTPGNERRRGMCWRHYGITYRPERVTKLWRDARPLLAAIASRPEPVWRLLDITDQRAFYRARQSGRISDAIADRIAIRALGLTVDEVYGHDLAEVA